MEMRSLRSVFAALTMPAVLLAGCEQSLPPPLATTPLMAIETPRPAYPPELACADIGGRVLLRVSVGLEGKASRVELLESSGQPVLDAAAIEAVRTWRFEPATRGGQPALSQLNVPVTFTPPVEKPDMCFALEDRQRARGT